TTTTTVETTIPQTDLPTEPPTESEIVYQSPEEYESVGEQDISEYVVILNNSTMCYHLSGSCRAAKRIAVENYEEVVVNSIDDVLSWGYAPCGVCAEG
ncbi:MAG: hypothetical protein IJ496_10665, partial [Ruminococcus sp.]|nr:hypothetical protein [Ruminococcus sp.]